MYIEGWDPIRKGTTGGLDPKHKEACTVQAYVHRTGPNQAGSEGGRVGPQQSQHGNKKTCAVHAYVPRMGTIREGNQREG